MTPSIYDFEEIKFKIISVVYKKIRILVPYYKGAELQFELAHHLQNS